MRQSVWPSIRLPNVLLSIAAVVSIAACGQGSAATVSPSPAAATNDARAQAYIALIHAYWSDIRAADTAPDGSDIDARVCLGEVSPTSPSDVKVVDPSLCRTYAMATLAANEKFLIDLNATATPTKFAADDGVFRTQIPQAITHLKALIIACSGASRSAVVDAMFAYASDMIPDVTDALDHVDPNVAHET